MPDAWVDARSMHPDEHFVVCRLRYFDVAKLERRPSHTYLERWLSWLPLLPSSIAFSTTAFSPIFKFSLRGSHQIVDLPSQDEMEDDERENA